jgi:beta-galactosidase GanA
VKSQRPLAGTNRGLWYDWARFNQDRFTDYLLWVRGQIRGLDATVPLAAGGSSSMLAGHTGTSGIDEERIVNEVDDVIIHEGGGSTLGMDLQMALSEKKKPLADPEMSLDGVENLLPHFLHGKSVAQLYHWPAQPANEFYSNDRSSLAHSWEYSLQDVDEVLRAAIDVRRLNKEIAAFVDAPAEIAILYSQTSTLQLPAEMLTWRTTPYLVELRRAYEASRTIDAKVTFVTERQAVRGALARYRLLLIPGVRNIPPEVVKAIGDYVAAGGHALILPESLLGDEYNRPQPFLAQFGVAVRSTERPRADESGRMVQGYDQSFAHDVAFSGGASGTLEPALPAFAATGALMSAGVRQTIEPAAGDQILYRYPDGRPAIVRAHVGNGVADYAAASLAEAGYARLLDKLAGEAGVSRPVRVRLDGAPGQRVEVRFARLGERRLLYLFNANSKPMRARVESNEGRVTSLTELRGGHTTRGDELVVPARQTNIYELFRSTPLTSSRAE